MLNFKYPKMNRNYLTTGLCVMLIIAMVFQACKKEDKLHHPPNGSGNQPSDTIEYISVTGGTYMMGCTVEQGNDCYNDEVPSHLVTLNSFEISKY